MSATQTQPPEGQSPNTYEWFLPPIWSNWALVIAATVAACVALKTLDAIRRSNRAALIMARAARKSADVAEKQLRHIERPWIAFEVTELHGTKYIVDRIKRLHPTLREPEDSLTVEIIRLRVQYRFNNCGRTPARLVAGSVELICAEPKTLPTEPFYKRFATPESLLPPGKSEVNSLIVQVFPPSFEKFVKGQESLIIFGFVQYRDLIAEGDDSLHESRFRMECNFPGYDPIGGEITLAGPFYFAFAGPETYNRYT